jgi:hypothetical protein
MSELETDLTENAPQPGSVWGALREQHKEIVDNTDPLYLDDPIHPGVVFRYHYVPLRDTKKASKRISKIRDKTEQTLASAIETILLSLDEILIASGDGVVPKGQHDRELYSQPLRPLAEEGEPAMKFDERLVAGMEFPEGTSRVAASIVLQWFARKEYLIIEHAQEISAWFTEVGDGVREEFGEALGGA